MIDKDTDKLTLVHFPRQSGGKFLINCLSLSDRCVFARSDLVQKQLRHELDYQDKLAYLQRRLAQSASDHTWNDLDLGCFQMFGLPVHSFAFANADLHFLLEKYADPVMHDLSASGLKWFMTVHDTGDLRHYVRYWSNCKVIILMNVEPLLRLRKQWVDRPSHQFFHEVFALDTEQIQQQLAADRVFAWDCNWYLDQEHFLYHLGRCATWLDLDLTDSEGLSWYRETWLTTIMDEIT